MRRTFYMITALLILAAPNLKGQAKKDAEEILREVTEKTKSYTSIKIDFTYSMDNPGAKIHESEKGSLLVKGEKYRLNIAGQIVISDGSTIWTYLPDANEVQVNSVEEDENAITPTKMLTSWSENYKAKLVDEQKKGTNTYYIIDLKPMENKTYTNVELTIDKLLKRIVKMAVQDNNGNTFSYVVDNFKPNILIDPSDFTFNPSEHLGVDVIDMR